METKKTSMVPVRTGQVGLAAYDQDLDPANCVYSQLCTFALRACGVKRTRTELPPVNTGFDPNNESQQRSANAIKRLSNSRTR